MNCASIACIPALPARGRRSFRDIMPVREKYSPNVGIWTGEAPQPNEVVHMWNYPDLNTRMTTRAAVFKDPDWLAFVAKGSGSIVEMHSTLLLPTSFLADEIDMKLGLSIGYSGAQLNVPVALVQRAEELGYDSVWTAEAYGSDAVTPLAYLAAVTKRIRLGTGIMQLAARSAANAAMCAGTVDALAGGGRFIAGLGVSGPQIVEGWYGEPWGRPYYRLRDYVAIMRKIFRREEPVTHDGREISLPFTGEGALGVGKPLKSILHMNPNIPIYLATGNESTVKLTAEIADGWLPNGFVPGSLPEYLPWLEEGFRRAGNGKTLRDFDIQTSVHVRVHDDVKEALAALKPEVALYVGGMGHRDKNFHKDMMIRRGFGDAADRVQELYPRASQGRSRRGGAGRMGGFEIAGRAARAHQAALSRVGGIRRHRPDGPFPRSRGDRRHGGGGTAQSLADSVSPHVSLRGAERSAPGYDKGARASQYRARLAMTGRAFQ